MHEEVETCLTSHKYIPVGKSGCVGILHLECGRATLLAYAAAGCMFSERVPGFCVLQHAVESRLGDQCAPLVRTQEDVGSIYQGHFARASILKLGCLG